MPARDFDHKLDAVSTGEWTVIRRRRRFSAAAVAVGPEVRCVESKVGSITANRRVLDRSRTDHAPSAGKEVWADGSEVARAARVPLGGEAMALQLSVTQSRGKLRVYANNSSGTSGSGRVDTGWAGLMVEMNYAGGPAKAHATAEYWEVDQSVKSPSVNVC
jgi:hypothetical protein